MNEIVPFVFEHDQEATPIRTLMRDGDPWFVAVDVCRALGLDNTTGALRALDADETTLITNKGSPGPGLNIVSEPGLYALIGVSRKPAAKVFKRWVNHEVLPALRKTGRYELPMTADGPLLPDLLEAVSGLRTDVSDLRTDVTYIRGKLDGGREGFSKETVRYVCEGHAKYNDRLCWYCNDAEVVDEYGQRLKGKSELHHADGNRANNSLENCMLPCTTNGCHHKLTHKSDPDHIPAWRGLGLADTFHRRLRQKRSLIRPPNTPANIWEFRPMKQTNMGFPAMLPPGKREP